MVHKVSRSYMRVFTVATIYKPLGTKYQFSENPETWRRQVMKRCYDDIFSFEMQVNTHRLAFHRSLAE